MERCKVCGREFEDGYEGVCSECIRKVLDEKGLLITPGKKWKCPGHVWVCKICGKYKEDD